MNAYTSKDMVCQMVIGMKEGGKQDVGTQGLLGMGHYYFIGSHQGRS